MRQGEKRTEAEQSARGNSAYTWEPHHTLTHWRRSGYGNQLQHFAQCILTKQEPYPSLFDGYRNLLVARCILEACSSGSVIDVPKELDRE